MPPADARKLLPMPVDYPPTRTNQEKTVPDTLDTLSFLVPFKSSKLRGKERKRGEKEGGILNSARVSRQLRMSPALPNVNTGDAPSRRRDRSDGRGQRALR